jgi:hypothetical protein
LTHFSLSVNAREIGVDTDPQTPLLWVLRDALGLTGTKYGCGMGLCGACTVHLDGDSLMFDGYSPSGIKDNYHNRGPVSRRKSPCATCLDDGSRTPVWLLSIRADHAGGQSAGPDSASYGRADQRSHERKHLSMRNLPENSTSDPAGLGGEPWVSAHARCVGANSS